MMMMLVKNFNDSLCGAGDDGMTIDDNDVVQHNNMYDRMTAQPQIHFKSRAIRTPYSVYVKKRIPKLFTLS